MAIKNYSDFRKINEVRTPKKCPVLSFKPIRESEVYKDMESMGFSEVIAENPLGIEVIGTAEQRYFKDRLGNIGFFHPALQGNKKGYPYFNIKHNGSIKVCTGPSKSAEFPKLSNDLSKACMTVEDYLFKMGFLIKYLIKKQGFPVSDDELYSKESYKDLIRRKITEDPSLIQKIELPQSLKKEDLGKGASILKRMDIFNEENKD